MSLFLKRFSTHQEYDAYINGSGAILPNVSICTTEGDVHYNPYVEIETRVVAKFNVTDTSNPTQISYKSQYFDGTSGFSAIEIDGVVQPSVVSAYTFSTTGEHTVKYTLTNPTSICKYAFAGCSGLTSIFIPDSVTSIGDVAFNNCYGLTSIDIPSGVTRINTSLFDGCSGLTNVNIPDSVTSIGGMAFRDCSSLTSITIPSSVTTVGDQAFHRCYNLVSITSNAIAAPTIASATFQNVKTNGTLYVPIGSGGYDTWMGTGSYYLGKYNWTKVEK